MTKLRLKDRCHCDAEAKLAEAQAENERLERKLVTVAEVSKATADRRKARYEQAEAREAKLREAIRYVLSDDDVGVVLGHWSHIGDARCYLLLITFMLLAPAAQAGTCIEAKGWYSPGLALRTPTDLERKTIQKHKTTEAEFKLGDLARAAAGAICQEDPIVATVRVIVHPDAVTVETSTVADMDDVRAASEPMVGAYAAIANTIAPGLPVVIYMSTLRLDAGEIILLAQVTDGQVLWKVKP